MRIWFFPWGRFCNPWKDNCGTKCPNWWNWGPSDVFISTGHRRHQSCSCLPWDLRELINSIDSRILEATFIFPDSRGFEVLEVRCISEAYNDPFSGVFLEILDYLLVNLKQILLSSGDWFVVTHVNPSWIFLVPAPFCLRWVLRLSENFRVF